MRCNALQCTATRFREEQARHGGVDLAMLQSGLEESADEVLVDKVRAGTALWTIIVIVGLPVTVAAQTYILIALLHSHG
jgi:hypothetical protein